jgi:putative SOS response-associated peptidase YedK
MCNLYSITINQEAFIRLFRVVNRFVGNLAPMPGVFPDSPAPVMRSTDDGTELAMMRWGMPMSTSGTFETCRPAVTVSAFGENRKSSTESQTDALDPIRT